VDTSVRTQLSGEVCPVARALDALGDPWALLIQREVFAGNRRFDGLKDELGIADTVLSERLQMLVHGGLLQRVPYSGSISDLSPVDSLNRLYHNCFHHHHGNVPDSNIVRKCVKVRLEPMMSPKDGAHDFNHGAWLKGAGINRKVLRAIIGNPLIAITMLRHDDVTAGLFAPVEVLLVEEDDGHSSLTYVQPSSLMVVAPNPPLLAAAQQLDAKLAALAATVTS
jgi:HxlR-like helix-turn-helix/Domain of unknown function DUF302